MRRRGMPVVVALLAASVVTACTPAVRWVSPNSGATGAPSADPSAGPAAWKPCPDVANDLLSAQQQKPPANIEYDCATVPESIRR